MLNNNLVKEDFSVCSFNDSDVDSEPHSPAVCRTVPIGTFQEDLVGISENI